MKKYQNTLLAGVAALALVAGAGIASAQQSNEHGGAMGGSKGASPQAGQSMNRGGMQSQAQEKGKGTQTQAQEKGGGTQTQAQEKGKSTQNEAQERGKTNDNATAQTGKENNKPTGQETGNNMGKRGTSSNERAERMNRGSKNNRQNTAEQQRTMKGLQGNTTKPMQGENQQGSNPEGNTSSEAKGGNVRLSDQQRTQIRDTVIHGHNAPRVGHVDFDVRVGTVVPRGRIHAVAVPETLVRIEPRWRGFLYFVYEDEVVIVNPRTMHIIAVVPA